MGKKAFKKKGSLLDKSPACRVLFNICYFLVNLGSCLALAGIIGGIVLIALGAANDMSELLVAGVIAAIVSSLFICIYMGCSFVEVNKYCKVKKGDDDIDYAKKYINKMRSTMCVLEMSIKCFHWEERVTYTKDSEGKNVRHVKREKVYTYEKTKKNKYKSWEDRSDEPDWDKYGNLIHLYTEMEFKYADDYTKEKMEKKKSKFIAKYSKKDREYEYHTRGYVPGIKEDFSFAKDGNVPFHLTSPFYFLSIFCCYGALHRCLFDSAFKDVKFKIKKYISRDKKALPNKTKHKYKTDFSDVQQYQAYQQQFMQGNMYQMTDYGQEGFSMPQQFATQQQNVGMVPQQMAPVVPQQQQMMPQQGGMMPQQGGMMPQQGGMMPQQGGMMPQQGGMMPQQGGMMPQQGGMMPQQGGMMPQGDGMMMPQQGGMGQAVMMPQGDGMMPQGNQGFENVQI